MHELFTEVLINKEFSEANEIFTVSDDAILNDLYEIINKICEFINLPEYVNNKNYQSVVEICITKITTVIRVTGTIEQYADGLIALLDSCLDYNHMPSQIGEIPPSAKILSDIILCFFLVSHVPINDWQKLDLLELIKRNDIYLKNMHALPSSFEICIPLLCEYLSTIKTDIATLQVFLNLAINQTTFLSDSIAKNKKVTDLNVIHNATQILSAIGKLNKSVAHKALYFIFDQSFKLDGRNSNILAHKTILLCTRYPELFTDEMLIKTQISNGINFSVNKIPKEASGTQSPNNSKFIKTIQTDNSRIHSRKNANVFDKTIIIPRRRLMADSHSIGGLHSLNIHNGMANINGTSRFGSVKGLHKNMIEQSTNKIYSTNTSSDGKTPLRSSDYRYGAYFKYPVGANIANQSSSFSSRLHNSLWRPLTNIRSSALYRTILCQKPLLSRNLGHNFDPVEIDRDNYSTVTIRQNDNTRVLTRNSNIYEKTNDPHLMRDTVQHFCDKHLQKIKDYMGKIAFTLPPPMKCTIEERKSKRVAKMSYGCENQGEYCLHDHNLFTIYTQYPHVWIHLMFLDVQSSATSAFSSRDPLISALKNCWDILEYDTRSFTTLVTSAFPNDKIVQNLLNELRFFGYFDLFDHCILNDIGTGWNCILCNRPEEVFEFVQCSEPVVESELEKKKGYWRLFKKWETRYFTLSRSHLSYKNSKNDKEMISIRINQILRVKVKRNNDNTMIPNAYKIFTAVGSFTLKPLDRVNAERWAQCLSIVVAYSRSKRVGKKH